MPDQENIYESKPDRQHSLGGGTRTLGMYRPGFRYKKESLQFFKTCVGEDIYNRAMQSDAGNAHHYAVARAFLSQSDWEKFCWIEEYGSLAGFPQLP